MGKEIDFGLKIKQLIDSKDETFEAAGKRLNSNKSTVYRWTTQKDVGTDILKQVCAGYGIPMSYFLSDSTSYVQKDNTISGGINAVGEKIMQYGNMTNNTGLIEKQDADTKLLIERLKGCEEQNKLLRDMVDILKKK